MSNTDDNDQQEDTFLTNIIKAFVIILLTIGLIYIRNMLAKLKNYFPIIINLTKLDLFRKINQKLKHMEN